MTPTELVTRPTHVAVAFDGPILRLRDGALMGVILGTERDRQFARARYSKDHGLTWGDEADLLALPMEPGWWLGFECLVDREGEIHLFALNDAHTGICWAGEGERPPVGGLSTARLDIWHTRTTRGRKHWQAPKKIWQGYTGALNSVIQMSNGRIVLPFSYLTDRGWAKRGGGLGEWSFMGQFDSTVVCSDDAGATWQQGNAIKIVTPDISYAYGACEPVVLQMNDGRVWMLIRGQTGRFYEAYSRDGAEWSHPRPTAILSSDSPAGLCRLDDGRIVLIWNNCLRFPYAYGGRQVIHAAISGDEGQTWQGFREVARDPLRHDPPPPDGDFGTGYPFPSVAANGKILMMTGQGKGRRGLVILDPAYLCETAQREDFSNGLENWSVFGTKGVELEAHPDDPARRVLALRRADDEFPAGAVWNFPAGSKGRIALRLLLRKAFAGCRIALTDHYSVAYDEEDVFFNLFNISIDAARRLEGGATLRAGHWHDLELRWDCTRRTCRVRLNGKAICSTPLLRDSREASYLRLCATAQSAGEGDGGFMVESVDVRVE